MVKKYLGVSVFAQMTLVTLGLSQTVGTTALVTQHPSVAGKTKQLQALLSIQFMGQEGDNKGYLGLIKMSGFVFQTQDSQGWLLV